jgi:hypothetical protein
MFLHAAIQKNSKKTNKLSKGNKFLLFANGKPCSESNRPEAFDEARPQKHTAGDKAPAVYLLWQIQTT